MPDPAVPTEFEHDFFLVHAGKAMPIAEELHERLQGQDGARVFLDKASIPQGSAWPDVLGHALLTSRIVVVLLTPAVVSSFYVPEEVHRAIASMRASGSPLIVPVYLEGTTPGVDSPYGLYGLQSITVPPGSDLAGLADRLLTVWKQLPVGMPVASAAGSVPMAPRPLDLIVDARGGEGTYSTVRRALANAAPDATIRIRPGLYDETLTITQPVHLVGEGPAESVILQSFNATTITLAAPSGRISGITVRQQGGTFPYQAIDISAGMPVIEGCIIVGGTRSAVRARGTSTPSIDRNIISGTSGIGVELGDFASPFVRDNWIRDLAETGVWVGGRAHPIIQRNLIRNCAGEAVWIGQQARVSLVANAVTGCGQGVSVADQAFAVVVDNVIEGSRRSAVTFSGAADGVVSGNVLRSSGAAQVLVASTGSPTFESNTIEQGRADGVVVVGPSGKEPVTFIRNRICENQWSGAFVKERAVARFRENLVRLNRDNGITIHDGAGGDYESNLIEENGQNGVSLDLADAPDLTQNRITANGWSGIYVSASSPRCDRNHVFDNPWGAVTIANGASPALKENDLSAKGNAAVSVHDAKGAALFLNHVHHSETGLDVRMGAIVVRNNTIDDNRVGIRVASGSEVVFDQNSLLANEDPYQDRAGMLTGAAAASAVLEDVDPTVRERRQPLFVRRIERLSADLWGADEQHLADVKVPGDWRSNGDRTVPPAAPAEHPRTTHS